MDEDFESNETKETPKPTSQDLQKTASYFSILYWQTYFEINQYELYNRLKIITNIQDMKITPHIQEKTELYGPFWIATSLIFCLFAFGNLSGAHLNETYEYQFLSKAFLMVYGYLTIIPLLLYFVLKFQGSSGSYL